MKISIVTDEISADPETALELGTAWGVHDFELRGFFTDRAPRLSGYQKRRLKSALERYDSRIIAIGPGLFKIPYPPKDPPGFPLSWMDKAFYDHWSEANHLVRQHLDELLPLSLDYAGELGASIVLTFGFDRAGAPPGDPPDEVLETLLRAAQQASAAGIQLVVENEEGFWADTGARTARMIREINHPALAVNWDPGNAFFAGDDPFPGGYREVRGLVKHVHFKDVLRHADGSLEYAGIGQIDWAGQIRTLADDGFTGFISIETHLRPKVAAAKAALERLQNLIAAVRMSHPRPINQPD
jgi:sugar phosphate isomerase/epimerase